MADNFLKVSNGITYEPQSSDPSNPVEGDIQFADGTARPKGLWEYKDGAWSQVGTSGGSLDIFKQENFETTNAADLTSGQNATFDNGGTIGGTLADETASPISSDASLKYTTHATPGSSDDDFFYLPAITLDDKQKGNDIGMGFYYTWDGSDDLINVVIWDDTNNALLTSSLDLIKTKSNPTRYSTSVFIPTTCSAIKVGFHHTGVSESSKILVFDDIELSTNPFISKEIINMTEWATYTPTVTGFGTVTGMDSYYRRVGDSLEIRASFTSGTPTAVEARVDFPAGLLSSSDIATLEIAGNGGYDGSGRIVASLIEASLGYFTIGREDINGLLVKHTGSNLTLNGDIWSFNVKVPIEGWVSTTEHIVTPSKSNANVFTALIANAGSASITTQGGLNTKSENAIASVNRTGTGTVDITFTAGFFSEAPIVMGQGSQGTDVITEVSSTTTSGVTIVTQNHNSAALQDSNFNLAIHRTGDDLKNVDFLSAVPVQKIAYVKDVKSSGTSGGTTSTNSVATRDLNTLEGDTSFLSLATNQITLAAGKYNIQASAPSFRSASNMIFLYNVTNSTYDIDGQNSQNTAADFVQGSALLEGDIEITSTTDYEIRHWTETGLVTTGFGVPTTATGNPKSGETYTQVKITKLR